MSSASNHATIDLDFHVSAQAWALLHVLRADEDLFWLDDDNARELVEVWTAPLYMTRSNGFSMTVQRELCRGDALFICFYPHGSTGELVVSTWRGLKRGVNPLIDKMPDWDHMGSVVFDDYYLGKASDYIKTLVQQYLHEPMSRT